MSSPYHHHLTARNARHVFEFTSSFKVAAHWLMTEIGAEILRYDALRDTYLPEVERMHGEVAAALKNAEEHRAAMQTFADDLDQHRKTIEALRLELTNERRGAESVMEDRDLQVNGYKAKLAEREGLVASLTSMREAEIKELEARGVALNAANEALTKQNETIAEKNERIAELEQLATQLGRDVQGLIGSRDQGLAERDEARRLLVAERDRAEALATSARSLPSRAVRRLTLQKLDASLLEGQGPLSFDP